MSLWLRAGPLSVSSRGRMGVRAGPVSVYGGGRRRSSSGSGATLVVLLIAFGILIFVVMWPLSLFGHAIGLTPSWHQLMNRNHTWMHQHYALVGVRYSGAGAILLIVSTIVAIPLFAASRERAAARAADQQRRARAALEDWLAAPPPALQMPSRFTANWIAGNVPALHPGQVPALTHELKRRGWSDSDIHERVMPYMPDYASTGGVRRVS